MLDMKDWTDALKGGLPPVKLPKYVFGTAGCYSFMEEKLRPILEYEDLKTGVFQVSASDTSPQPLRVLLVASTLFIVMHLTCTNVACPSMSMHLV